MTGDFPANPDLPRPPRFPTTDWSEVEAAAHAVGQCGENAVAKMLGRYLSVLHTYLMFQWRAGWQDAEDLLHSFVVDKVLQKQMLADFEHRGVRFRSYLRVVLDNYVRNRIKAENAQKRHPGQPIKRVHLLGNLEDPRLDAATRLDLIWGQRLLEDSITQLQAECQSKGQRAVWLVFEDRLLGPIFEGTRPTPYRELAAGLGFQDGAQACEALQTAKRWFRRIVKAGLRDYVSDDGEVDGEIEQLFGLFSGRGP